MRLMRLRWLVSSALLLVAPLAARAETRPHYGGTLPVQTQQAISALPKSSATPASSLAGRIGNLMFREAPICAGICPDLPGPFKVSEFVSGKKLTLVANENFPGGRQGSSRSLQELASCLIRT